MPTYYEKVKAVKNIELLKEEILTLLENHPLHIWDNQLCLTYPKNCKDPWYYGSGSTFYITENIQEFKQYDREVLLKEKDFTEINEHLGSYTTELLTELKEEFNLGRIRIMVSKRKHALTWHKDTEDRIHIPIITQEGCRMVIVDESFHMSAGSSIDNRIHIVGCII